MVELCVLCGSTVMRQEDVHACYDPPTYEQLFRDPAWGRMWDVLRRQLHPSVVRAAYSEFAAVKAQGREATRLFALGVYRQWHGAVLAAEQAKRDGKDPRELLVNALGNLNQAAGNH